MIYAHNYVCRRGGEVGEGGGGRWRGEGREGEEVGRREGGEGGGEEGEGRKGKLTPKNHSKSVYIKNNMNKLSSAHVDVDWVDLGSPPFSFSFSSLFFLCLVMLKKCCW